METVGKTCFSNLVLRALKLCAGSHGPVPTRPGFWGAWEALGLELRASGGLVFVFGCREVLALGAVLNCWVPLSWTLRYAVLHRGPHPKLPTECGMVLSLESDHGELRYGQMLVKPARFVLVQWMMENFRGGQLAFFRRWRVAMDNAGHSEWSGIGRIWKHGRFRRYCVMGTQMSNALCTNVKQCLALGGQPRGRNAECRYAVGPGLGT